VVKAHPKTSRYNKQQDCNYPVLFYQKYPFHNTLHANMKSALRKAKISDISVLFFLQNVLFPVP
jgi:hypothetical protein